MKPRCWKYPVDEPLPVPERISFPAQRLIISANPEDHDLPWGVILEDGATMYDVADLAFSGDALAKTDWGADNYWFPRMWIEVYGALHIAGSKAWIEAGRDGRKGVGTFDVLREMAIRDMDIRLSTLDNVTDIELRKGNTFVRIGCSGNFMGIAKGEFVGGLLIANNKQFKAIKKELESTSESNQGNGDSGPGPVRQRTMQEEPVEKETEETGP